MKIQAAKALFVGAVLLSLGIVVNMVILVTFPGWAKWSARLACGLWMGNIVLISASALIVPVMLTDPRRGETSFLTIAASLVYPIITPLVSAASGFFIATTFQRYGQVLIAFVVAYAQLAIHASVCLVTMVTYMHRLLSCVKISRRMVFTCFHPLGVLNMAAIGIIQLGRVSNGLCQSTFVIRKFGSMFEGFCLAAGVSLWTFSICWTFFAVTMVIRSTQFRFSVGLWSFVGPVGTSALSSSALYQGLHYRFFAVIAATFAFVAIAAWVPVVSKKAKRFWAQRWGPSAVVETPTV